MSTDGHRRSGSPGNAAHQHRAEIKRAVYVLARGGIIGLVTWIYRSDLKAAAARYVTGPVAAAIMGLSLVLLAIGNNLHIEALAAAAGASLLLTPLAFLAGWVRRNKEAYWAAEHGRDSKAFKAEIEADERRVTEAVGKDDWLVFPPWREPGYEPKPPRFGRER